VSGASYDPRRGPGLDAEIDRLEAQAALAWREEERVLRELGVDRAGTLVEVGCGSGALLARLHELAPGARLVGVEPDADLRERARGRVPPADVVDGSAGALPLGDASVDAVVLRFVLQHLADPVAALREARRVLRPGGVAVAIEVDGALWGLAQPSWPEVQAVQAKAWAAQARRGGNRMIGRRLHRLLAAAGFAAPELRLYAYHSDDLGLDAFAPLLDPAATLEQAVADGAITPAEYGVAVTAYRRFRADPDAFVLLAGLLAFARA
jgi:ubiquinone/menaquinone biosynthesis C-methylase UbiE